MIISILIPTIHYNHDDDAKNRASSRGAVHVDFKIDVHRVRRALNLEPSDWLIDQEIDTHNSQLFPTCDSQPRQTWRDIIMNHDDDQVERQADTEMLP